MSTYNMINNHINYGIRIVALCHGNKAAHSSFNTPRWSQVSNKQNNKMEYRQRFDELRQSTIAEQGKTTPTLTGVTDNLIN